MSETRTQ